MTDLQKNIYIKMRTVMYLVREKLEELGDVTQKNPKFNEIVADMEDLAYLYEKLTKYSDTTKKSRRLTPEKDMIYNLNYPESIGPELEKTMILCNKIWVKHNFEEKIKGLGGIDQFTDVISNFGNKDDDI